MMFVHCQDEVKQSIFKQSWKMNGLWSRGWSFHTETERWGKKAKEWKGGETVLKNPDESPKIICTQETEHRERECEGMRERGSLAFTTGASPKHITRATHKYFNTHTHTHKTNSLAHSLHRHRGKSKAGRKCWSTCLTYSSTESSKLMHSDIISFWLQWVFICLICDVCMCVCACLFSMGV